MSLGGGGLLVLKMPPKDPFWPKLTLFDPQLWIYLFNVSKILPNHATLSVKYELSIPLPFKISDLITPGLFLGLNQVGDAKVGLRNFSEKSPKNHFYVL